MARLDLHPDRLLPADPATRSVARRLHAQVAGLPIVSPHGHIDPWLLAEDRPFENPAQLLVSPDHYVTRLLHAAGVGLDRLGAGQAHGGTEPSDPRQVWADPRQVWRELCGHWWLFRGTPTRYWLEAELVELFAIDRRPDAANADALYDQIAEQLADAAHRPRALYARMGIEVLATSDDPADDLAAHRRLRQDRSWPGRVVPTFRPDRYLDPAAGGWVGGLDRLAEVSGIDTATYAGYVEALEQRRATFKSLGGTATDHGHPDAGSKPLTPADANSIFTAARMGQAAGAECQAFRRHMLFEMARMASEDGLVMALHPGVVRDHHALTAARFGPDVGADIPVATELTRSLRPILEHFGTHPNFRLVVFTVDETVYSRELAPLAGFYPSVFIGAPWWFLDAPDAIGRFRAAVTETAGFYRTAGFVDDTRAFCSIAARHDLARRMDCSYLARLVIEHRLPEDEAAEVAVDLVGRIPKEVFRL